MKGPIGGAIIARSLVGAMAFAMGCEDKKKEVPLAPSASSLSASTLPPAAKTMKFAIDPASTTTLEMEAPAKTDTLKGTTNAASGTLDVDFTNLANSRGEIKVDLTTLTMKTFAEKNKNESQTTHAHTWLEVGEGEDPGGKLEESVKVANRWAVYAIRSIENASATDLTKVAPTKDGADDVRKVTLTTKGEILIHGRKVDRDADVEVQFKYDAGAAASKPKAVAIKSKKPFRITIAEHDVKPRDGLGKINKAAFHLLGTKVAENADISLDLRAKPQS